MLRACYRCSKHIPSRFSLSHKLVYDADFSRQITSLPHPSKFNVSPLGKQYPHRPISRIYRAQTTVSCNRHSPILRQTSILGVCNHLTFVVNRSIHLSQYLCSAEHSPTEKTRLEQTLDLLKEEIRRDTAYAVRSEEAAQVVPKKSLWTRFCDECMHYYHGFRLLAIETKLTLVLGWRVLRGSTLTRREKKQLVRTVSDLFRLVPFSVFIIIPFMEVLLPVAIKLFPGLLPSTFQTTSKEEEKVRRQLKVRLEMAKFLQETLEQMSMKRDKKTSDVDDVDTAQEFADFMKRIREGGYVATNKELMKFSKVFEDELTLDNLSIQQLRAVCRIVGITPIGTQNLLRLQLDLKLRELKADDRLIVKEGVDQLTVAELQAACRARGMRALGVSQENLRKQLSQWLELSLSDKVPPSLLLLSRTLYLPEDISFGARLNKVISELPNTVAEEAKIKLSELEGGKIDNKAKWKLVAEIEEALRVERSVELKRQKQEAAEEEQRAIIAAATADAAAKQFPQVEETLAEASIPPSPFERPDIAPVLRDAAPKVSTETETPEIKWDKKDIQELSTALGAVTGIKEEKADFEELKEDYKEYKEEIKAVESLVVLKGEEIHESTAARRLRGRVNSLISQMDGLFDKLQSEKTDLEQIKDKTEVVLADGDVRMKDLVSINELLLSLRRMQKVPDDFKEQRIREVLDVLDEDHDGSIDVDLAFRVIDILGRENVKINPAQMQNITKLLRKEEVVELDEELNETHGPSLPVKPTKATDQSTRSPKPPKIPPIDHQTSIEPKTPASKQSNPPV